ncbi:MAG: hypothetical protein M3Y41_18390 [Pseudomonadota bacterium]|nr:hypothetical protein [Pseudomonadota bacterium]
MRTNHLHAAVDYCRAGVVLIGDAFQMSCPATGTGIVRLMTDVDRLCNVHVPRWLASPGMGADKIAQFYGDPVKIACDAEAFRAAEYQRSAACETALSWRMHRFRVDLGYNLRARIKGLGGPPPRLLGPAGPTLPAPGSMIPQPLAGSPQSAASAA